MTNKIIIILVIIIKWLFFNNFLSKEYTMVNIKGRMVTFIKDNWKMEKSKNIFKNF
jgi:hypothetical protein